MDKAAIDIAKALVRLSELMIFELRGEWQRLHRMPPPMRLSRDLLTRGITYKLQERAYGGLSMATARELERAAADPLSRVAARSFAHSAGRLRFPAARGVPAKRSPAGRFQEGTGTLTRTPRIDRGIATEGLPSMSVMRTILMHAFGRPRGVLG